MMNQNLPPTDIKLLIALSALSAGIALCVRRIIQNTTKRNPNDPSVLRHEAYLQYEAEQAQIQKKKEDILINPIMTDEDHKRYEDSSDTSHVDTSVFYDCSDDSY